MRETWLYAPAAYYGAISVGLCCCAYLIWSARKALLACERKKRERQEALEKTLLELRSSIATLETTVADLGKQAAARAPRNGLNLTRRAHALRMDRRGESASTIAAALGCPQAEVDLLLKVQRMAFQQPEGPAGPGFQNVA